MPDTFTFDKLNSQVEPKTFSFDDLNAKVESKSFSFDDLNSAFKPQPPQFDAASARGPDAPERPTPPDTGPSGTGWGGQGMGFGANDPVLPIGDLIFNQGGINPGFQIAKQAVSAISPKAGQLEKGSEETARETLNGLTTPKNLALMLGSLGIASTGATAARLVSALWAGVMGKQAIEDAPKIATEIGTEVGSA